MERSAVDRQLCAAKNEEVNGLKEEGKVVTPEGPLRRFVRGIRPHWGWLLAAAVLVGLAVPIIASAYISTAPSADRNWFWQEQLPQGNDLRSASWISNTVGWAVGVTGTALKTTDGGATWIAQDASTTRDLTGVSFVDANNGWACGVSGTVIRTTDGGTTWSAQSAPTNPAARNFRAISFINANVGVAVGDVGTTTSTIAYTNDGGATWRSSVTTCTQGLSDVTMVSATTGWAVGGAGALLKTVNGGANWTTQVSPTAAGLSAIDFAPGGTTVGYFVGNAILPNWTIYKTTNGGGSWTAVTGLGVTGALNLTGVSCLDATNAMVVATNGAIRHTTDGGTTWSNQSVNNLGQTALRDVKLISATQAKTIGDTGATFYTNNGGDAWFTPMLGNSALLQASSFPDAVHGWLAGANGTIMRTADAGLTWETQASGITVWRGIHFVNATTGWVVGDGGQIKKTTDGVNWVSQTSGVTTQLNGVWFINTTTGIAVGNNGTVLTTADGGTTWRLRDSGRTWHLNAVWSASATSAYAVGDGGRIRRSTNAGRSWTGLTSGTGQNLLAVHGMSATNVWVSGNSGTILRTTNSGTNWTPLTSGAGTNPVRAIKFVDANTGWFASNYGLVSKTANAGTLWTPQNAAVPTSTLDAITGFWTLAFPSATTGFLAGDGGVIRRTTNAGTSWQSQQYGTLSSLNCVAFPDATNGWISGGTGTMMHTSDSGQTWSQQKTGTGSALNGVWMTSATSGWAVGDNGAVRRTVDAGQTWQSQNSSTTVNLKTVSAGTASAAIMAGQGVVKYTTTTGSTWTSASVPPSMPLNCVYMTDANNAWGAAGRIAGNNVVWRTTNGGDTWSSQATTANANLWGVYFRTATEGYAVGDSGVILKTTDSGANWVRKPTPTTLPFYWIRFTDANTGWAVGGGGVIAQTVNGGDTWTLRQSGTARALTSVAFIDSNRGWISGGNGTILRSTDLAPPSTAITLAPSPPNGTNDWYVTTPTVTLTSSQPGTTYYGWTSDTGPFAAYSAPFLALEGDQLLYYYSVDTSSNAEAVKTASIKTDVTPPDASTLVTVTAVTTSTAAVMWAEGADAISGVVGYRVYVDGVWAASSDTTDAVLTGLTQNTLYSINVATVDGAGNLSAQSIPAAALTMPVDNAPLTTVLGVLPAGPDGSNGWYVTTPTVTMSALPSTVTANIYYNWESVVGTYTAYTTTITPPAAVSTLNFSAHDGSAVPVRADEPTRQASFLVDTSQPSSPSVTASATSYSTIQLDWPGVIPSPSGIARYEVYVDGGYLTEVASPTIEVVGLSPSTTYSFVVYARSVAGAASVGSTPQTATTLPMPRPDPPSAVMAKAPTGDTVYMNWSPVTSTVGGVNYHVWRSTDGATYSVVATTTGGAYDCSYIDRGLRSSTRYWYAVSTVDARGESALSSTATATWPYTAPTTIVPDRVLGGTATGLSNSVYLSWVPQENPAVVGYYVRRGTASMSAMTTITAVPTSSTAYFDLTAQNGGTYYYQIAAVDASGAVGNPSIDIQARPAAPIPANQPQPHYFGAESACICHATHSSTTLEPLVRFPGSTKNTMCQTCHAPSTSQSQFVDPLLQSKHPMGATVTATEPYTCATCHVPLVPNGAPLNNLMRVNSSSPCVVVTSTPAGNGFCYSCHGVGSTLPMGNMAVFEASGHSTVPAPTAAGIVCDNCHESHSSRNPQLLDYAGFMVCMQCHTASASNPLQVDILSKLMLNEGANTKHPLLPQDQTTGARMTCQNCHNTHTTTKALPLVDPHNPSPAGTWPTPRSDEKAFCFRCHDGQPLPTSAETTPWATPVLGRSAATTTSDIQARYQVNAHGFGSRSQPTTTNAYLRPDMGYAWGDVLECRACHDPHGTANNDAILDTVPSADGTKKVYGVLTYRMTSPSGKDFRFFCTACHIWDSASHDSRAGTSTVSFPMNCKACHGHSVGTPPGVNF